MEVDHFTFYDDLNIHHICSEVVTVLDGYIQGRASYEREYRRLKKIIEKSHNPADRARAVSLTRDMDRYLGMIRDGTLTDVYKKKVQDSLNEYNILCGTSRIFGMDKCTNIPRRIGIIISFLNITKEFHRITWTCTYNMNKICPRCYSLMRKCGPVMMCDQCKYSHKAEKMLNVVIDGDQIKVESTYDASKNFRKEYSHVCGTIHDMRDGEREDIESYLYRAGFKSPTRENIRDSIRACGYNNYHDTNLLYHQITSQPLPPIAQYIDICSARFEQYFQVFQSLHDKEGHNITNLHFLIRLFLWQEKIPYDDTWFRSLSESTEAKHRRNAKKVCSILKTQDIHHEWNIPDHWID